MNEKENDTASKITAPNISLPKGGGAIKGIGETFQPDAFSGTGNFSIPIYATPSRNFEPNLSLDYNSGSGNGAFGIGFSLSLPKISRRTEKGIPGYDDSDVFIFPGMGELTPKLKKQNGENGNWVKDIRQETKNDGSTWSVCLYSPRVEGAFEKIEHWTCITPEKTGFKAGISYWHIVTANNETHIYGQSAISRIADPADETRIFEWLIESSVDARGNKIIYSYKQEDGVNVPTEIYEAGRSYTAIRYIQSIKYGNYYIDDNNKEQFAFEIVFDYGERVLPKPNEIVNDPYTPVNTWAYRQDPFSSYRSGFEIRTFRLCQKVLMFHHFAELGEKPCLVRSTALHYKQTGVISVLQSVHVSGYRRKQDGSYECRHMPALELGFSSFNPPEEPQFKKLEIGGNSIPGYLDNSQFLPVDLYGEGLPGFLYSDNNTSLYLEPQGEGKYSLPQPPQEFPVDRNIPDGEVFLADLEGNSTLELVVNSPTRPGFYQNNQDGTWENYQPFLAFPTNISQPGMERVDLDADGKTDLLLVEETDMLVYPSLGKTGYAQPKRVLKQDGFPIQKNGYREELVTFADMFGDGLQHRVSIKNGSVECWPNLGCGRFAPKVTLGNAPRFDRELDIRRIFFADVDGSGAADLVYVYPGKIEVYLNQSGNSFPGPVTLMLPEQYSDIDQISFADILGNGTTCLVFTKIAPVPRHYYYDFVGEVTLETGETRKSLKPFLLNEINNNLGAVTQIQYCTSTKFYLEDKKAGRPGVTQLHFPVQVVEQVTHYDKISGSRYVNKFKYHDGYYDPVERDFRGFGYVETWDSETPEEFEKSTANQDFPVERLDNELFVPPVYTRSWYHTGAYIEDGMITNHYKEEYFQGDNQAYDFPDSVFDPRIYKYGEETVRQAYAALKGHVMRTEVYAQDNTNLAPYPYTVEEANADVILLQPAEDNQYAVFMINPRESISYHYERNPQDPRVQQQFTLEVDNYGNIIKSCTVFLPRRENPGIYPEQKQLKAAADHDSYINIIDGCRWIGVPCETREFEIFGLDLQGNHYFSFDHIKTRVETAFDNIVPYEGALTEGKIQARLLTWTRLYYWNEEQTGQMPCGQISLRGLLHHQDQAAFTKDFIAGVFAGKLTDDTITNDGGYVYDAGTGYWWNRGLVQFYFGPGQPGAFFMPNETANAFVDPTSYLYARTTVAYDQPYYLSPLEVSQFLDDHTKNVEKVSIDYITLQPYQLIDINDNVSQVLFDPMGQVIAASLFGTGNGQEVGGMRLYPYDGKPAEYELPADASFNDVIANRENYLQGAASFFYYDLFKWKQEGKPVCSISLLRDHYYHSADGTPSPFSCQTAIAYADGFARLVETKLEAKPNTAVTRDTGGTLARDDQDKPVLAEIQGPWQVSGRTVYNNKGKPCEQYLPYFSNTPLYETQKEIVAEKLVPPPTIMHYDPLLRVIRIDTPKGFFSKVEFTPWEEKHYDEDDTVLDSPYYKDFMAHYPPDPTQRQKDEKDALEKAAKFYDTSAVNVLDNSGSRFLEIQYNVNPAANTKTTLTAYYQTDIQGRLIKAIDPRLYQSNITKGTDYCNFKYKYAMGEESPLYTDSADAGLETHFSNIFGGLTWSWSPRDYNQVIFYDRLQRRLQVRVKKTTGDQSPASYDDYNLVEVYTYGETQENPEDNNLRGQVYRLHDLSGIVTNSRYSMQDQVQETSRQLTQNYKDAVDWKDPGKVEMETAAYTALFTYDALGRLISETTPDGSITTNTYNCAGLLETVTVTYSDGTKQPIINSILYDANRQRTDILYANGVKTTYTYENTTLRLINLYSTRPIMGDRNPVIQDIAYTYDPVGNITRTWDNTYKTVFCNNQVVDPLSDYTYDALYRLINANGRQHPGINKDTYVNNQKDGDFKQGKFGYLCPPDLNDQTHLENYTETYTYDDGGNLVKKQHTASSSSWSMDTPVEENSNRLKDREYDASGNLRQLQLNSAVTLSFNCCENLVKAGIITRPDELDDADYYNYDSNELRTRKVSERMAYGGSVTEKEEKIYLGNYEIKRIKSVTAEGETTILNRQTLRVMDGKTCVAIMHYWVQDDLQREVEIVGTRKLRYQLDNNLGSVSLEVDDDAALISYEEYFPYGGTAIIAGNNQKEVQLKEYRYSGKERDDSTGLYYYGARYYAPWLGRWLKPDPAGTVDGFNLYMFVTGNPVTYPDIGGMQKGKGKKKRKRKEIEDKIYTSKSKQIKVSYNNGVNQPFGGSIVDDRNSGLLGAHWWPKKTNTGKNIERSYPMENQNYKAKKTQNSPTRRTKSIFKNIDNSEIGYVRGHLIPHADTLPNATASTQYDGNSTANTQNLISTCDAFNYYPEPEGWGEKQRKRREGKARKRGVPLLQINEYASSDKTFDNTRIPSSLYFIEFLEQSKDQSYRNKKNYDAKAYKIDYSTFDYEALPKKNQSDRRQLKTQRAYSIKSNIIDFIHKYFPQLKNKSSTLKI